MKLIIEPAFLSSKKKENKKEKNKCQTAKLFAMHMTKKLIY